MSVTEAKSVLYDVVSADWFVFIFDVLPLWKTVKVNWYPDGVGPNKQN